MNTELVIFDLDGTLLNTIGDLAVSCNAVLALRGLPQHSYEEYCHFVGNGILRLVERALPEPLRTPENVALVRADFVKYYTEHIDTYTKPYPGIPELVADLARRGVRMAVASNKFQAGTEKLIRLFFPAAPFDVVFGQREGVPLKPERGNRVFPQSDKAADIIDALLRALRRAGVSIIQDRALSLRREGEVLLGVEGERNFYPCGAAVVATGGVSYPLTGSTGDGYALAQALGHTVVPPRPSLVPLVAEQNFCAAMQGLSLRNVAIKVKNGKGKTIYAEQGELLFTHFGLSGPLILTASAHMRDFEHDHYSILLDMKPALDEETLDQRLLRDLGENANRDFHNVLEGLVPRLMAPVLVELTGIPAAEKAHSVTKAQRRRLLETLKSLRIDITGPRPVEEAIVTSGGVKTGEVDPSTMMSKKAPGVYFAGEVLDVDGYTGGFNLQIAWSTGRAAGLAAGERVLAEEELN